MLDSQNNSTMARRTEETPTRDEGAAFPAPTPWYSHVINLIVEQRATAISLLILGLLAMIFYMFSRLSAEHLFSGAHRLGDTARHVVTSGGNDEVLDREILVQLLAIQRREDLSEALLHVSIAFGVAIIIVLTVEISSSSRRRREINEYRDAIARQVWTALSGRLVPAEIVAEIQGILKADAIKESVTYVITFLRYDGLPADTIVMQRKLTYTIRNLTGRRISHPVRSFIHSGASDIQCQSKGVKFTVPRHIDLQVNRKAVPLNEPSKTLRRNALGQLRDLWYDIELGRENDRLEVFLCGEEQVPIRGANEFVQTVPVTGLTVTIDNKIEDIVGVQEVRIFHPNWEEFRKGLDGIYRYTGAILPGQSLSVSWAPVAGPPSPKRAAEAGIRA